MNVSSDNAGDIGETEQRVAEGVVEAPISRRIAIGGVAFFGAAMSAIGSRAFAQPGAPVIVTRPSPQNRPVIPRESRTRISSAQ
jgi:hypothetical protein